MTRTIARRLATVGGALGIALLTCAGTAVADSAVPAKAEAQAVVSRFYGPHLIVLDEWNRSIHRTGVAGGLALDLRKLLHVLV